MTCLSSLAALGYRARVQVPGWLDDTRTSYDTVAVSYAEVLRDALAREPFQRGILALFAELVRAQGNGPVADIGCGPGRITAHLHRIGLDAFGVDLSPGMIDVARRDHPGLRFEVGSMTGLDIADGSLTGILAWFSLIHVPDDEVPTALAEFHRVLRPGGVVLLGFHCGDGSRLKTEGYGGHPMNVYVHHRRPDRVAAWLAAAGFTVEAELVHHPAPDIEGAFVFAHR
ncbi:class I SAM-dependent methyltransferase [Micromonospora sp. WMMD1082]|uniref:class I SAM-dependent DNA methyltransferase n=1 Tax=Micromonospora sp. WMMD1082 TaxID=3016104 RepID=UPI002416A00C|nr:class I SAM-dependent methyltransferase [Micromonospora sp. WMMD1082]MDG4798907.1 class I SAM-dependent methyltransferase [Micromonospora sp. WMMD1082]